MPRGQAAQQKKKEENRDQKRRRKELNRELHEQLRWVGPAVAGALVIILGFVTFWASRPLPTKA